VRRLRLGFVLWVLFSLLSGSARAENYLHLSLVGTVNPIQERYLVAGLERAQREGDHFVLLSLNTPGGLITSMQAIVSAITNAQVPVIGFVEPGSAQATSAGALILLATDIAAMAPGTRVGSAHPVGPGKALEPVLDEKATNSVEAMARSLAERRGRPTNLATDMVKSSKSFTASEAHQQKLVEILASDQSDLLRQLDGRKLDVRGRRVTLRTGGITGHTLGLSWSDRVLDVVAEPTLASMLMSLGLLGIAYELASPGVGLGGIVGTVCLLMGLLGLSLLPIGLAGVMLLLSGVAAVVVEAKVPSHGLLAGAGIVALVLGAVILVDPSGYFGGLERVAWWGLAPLVGGLALLGWLLSRAVRRAQRAPPQTGADTLIGRHGTAKTAFRGGHESGFAGTVFVDGARWQAESSEAIDAGEPIEVVAYLRQPSRLKIRPIEKGEA
jgi:membrane-bound serine protease (ClpP class)